MATFLILPPRELLEHAINDSLGRIFPERPIPEGLWERIVEEMTLTDTAEPTFVLHREELLDDGIAESLMDGYGAQQGDMIHEIDSPRAGRMATVRTWTLSAIPATVAAR